MQAYRAGFAAIYDQLWGSFATDLAPRLLEYYERTVPGAERSLLDLCCGTGHLAFQFLERGYRVTGLDLSPAMLDYARQRCQEYLSSAQAAFEQADAADFRLETPVGLVVSTYDALNHLESFAHLQACFDCVYAALLPGGMFVFDLNTRSGLISNWNGIRVIDTPDLLLVNRSIYDGEGSKAYTRLSGCRRLDDGHYERFEEVVYNTAFDMAEVQDALLQTGFTALHAARGNDLSLPATDLESDQRLFFIARK